jgi:glycerol-3-phosphate dehydrogenase
VDVAIVGGGIAGLWLLARLRQRGYGALLIESERLGAGQTICAQGIIHGGAKYACTGRVSDSAKALPGCRRCGGAA